jgi:hypothetical protein
MEKMKQGEKLIIRQEKPDELCEIPLLCIDDSITGDIEQKRDAA